jgi:hypothetical protein
VLGIISLVFSFFSLCTAGATSFISIILSTIGLVIGYQVKKEYSKTPAGLVLNIIGLSIAIVMLFVFIIFIIFAVKDETL